MARFSVVCVGVVAITSLLIAHPQSAQKSARRETSGLVPGSIAQGVYQNASLGFTCKIPFGWVDRTAEMRETEPQQNSDAAQSLVLLAVFERPPEATGSTINSAIVIAAEKISQYSGLKSAADYFGPITELATARGFTVANQPYEFSLGTKPLMRSDFSKPRGPLTMLQTSLVTLEKGYAVSFTFIGGSDDEVDKLIGNLSFGAKKNSSVHRQ